MNYAYISKLRKLYTNKTICLIQMDEFHAPAPGTLGS